MTKNPAKSKRKRGPGRLSANESAQLPDRLLDAAQAVFIEEGYARATMEAIAAAAGASRKTLYARYSNKEEMLGAVIQRLLATALPRAQEPVIIPLGDPRTVLAQTARAIAGAAGSQPTGGLNRLVVAESHQFPEIAHLAVQLQSIAVTRIRLILEQLHAEGSLPNLGDPQRAAQIFLEMTVSVQRRNAMMGLPMPKRESDQMIDQAVDIFLDGCAHKR